MNKKNQFRFFFKTYCKNNDNEREKTKMKINL